MGLQAGTYYARVTAPSISSRQTNYKLVLNLTGEYKPDDPNPEITNALDDLNGIFQIKDHRGFYPGQCVSLVKRFTKELGVTMNPMGGTGEYAGGAKYGFLNFNKPGLSLSAEQADKIVFTGSEQPKVGDIIFFNNNKWGHVAVVYSVLDNGHIIVQESNYDNKAWTTGTKVQRRTLSLSSNNVMGWLRLKL
jgi:surface antigen